MKIMSKIGAIVLLASSVAGCTFPLANGADQLPQVNNRFPIRVEPQVASIVVPVGADGSLQARDSERVKAFAEIWKARGYGTLGVSSEGAGASELALREIRGILSASHVGEESIRYNSLQSGDSGRPTTVSLTFMTDMAVAESCDGNWSENLAEEPRNMAPRDFACAHQQNLAALIEDPRAWQVIVEEARRRAANSPGQHLEAGWVLEDNIAMRRPIEMFGGKVDKIHRIYEKRLTTPQSVLLREGDRVDGTAASQDSGT